MKTLDKMSLSIALALLTGLVACKEKRSQETIVEDRGTPKFIAKNVRLENTTHVIFDKTLQDINADLVAVSEKKGFVSLGPGTPMEDGISVREKIDRNIQVINSLLDENKRRISYLSSQVKKYKKENSNLYYVLMQDAKRLEEYEVQLHHYKSQLMEKDVSEGELNLIINDLKKQNENLFLETSTYKKRLATGYYICKNRKELKKEGLLVEKGGVLGLGSTTMLNADASQSNFTQIDIHQTRSILIQGEKPELVTSHPEGSYEFRQENSMSTHLHIQNPDQFWRTSKYMVVAVR